MDLMKNALESKMKGTFLDLEQAIRIKYTRTSRYTKNIATIVGIIINHPCIICI